MYGTDIEVGELTAQFRSVGVGFIAVSTPAFKGTPFGQTIFYLAPLVAGPATLQ